MNGEPQSVSSHSQTHGHIVEDAALIASFQDGCSECFALLFHRYCKMVFAIGWKILREKSEVEDVVQEVFLSIYLQRSLYDSTRGSVKTWIGQFAQFKALSRRRNLFAREYLPIEEAIDFEMASKQAGSQLNFSERAALVEQCLTSLNPRQRRIIEAIHFDGYTLQETADLHSESLANTRNLYYRGMKSLRGYTQGSTPSTSSHGSTQLEDIDEISKSSLLFGSKI
jgi:RNA polymerase sigma factor (sigma-70 family)